MRFEFGASKILPKWVVVFFLGGAVVLIPWIVRGAVEAHLIQPSSEMTLFAAIQIAALVLLAFAFRRFLLRWVPDLRLASVMALTIYAVLPFNYFNLPYYPYDIPSVLFFTVGLLLIYDRNWRWFFPLFVAATLNRDRKCAVSSGSISIAVT